MTDDDLEAIRERYSGVSDALPDNSRALTEDEHERSHPASDGPALIYAYEVAEDIRSMIPEGEK